MDKGGKVMKKIKNLVYICPECGRIGHGYVEGVLCPVCYEEFLSDQKTKEGEEECQTK
jgi:rubrerythrin